MVFYTTVQAMYFTLRSNLENKAALKTTSEFFGKKKMEVKMYITMLVSYYTFKLILYIIIFFPC